MLAEVVDVAPEDTDPAPERPTSSPAADALARRLSVRELVAAFQRTERTIREAFAAISQAEEDLNQAFGSSQCGYRIRIDASSRGDQGHAWDDPDAAVERVLREAWQGVVGRLEIQRVMSAASWKELTEELERGAVLPFTEENIKAFAVRYAGDLPAIFSEKVAEVFAWLRPIPGYWGSQYKTNQRNATLEIGPRIIITGAVERWMGDHYRVHYHREQRFTALESVFCTLDGKGWGARTHHGHLHDAIRATSVAGDGTGETEYFRFRCFKNGNLHLEFLRPDLLKRFNQLAGGMNLRPAEEG